MSPCLHDSVSCVGSEPSRTCSKNLPTLRRTLSSLKSTRISLPARMARRLSYAEKGKGITNNVSPPRKGRVIVPDFDNFELLRKHELTLIGRVTNPKYQRMWSLIPFLGDLWKCSSRPIGADLGQGRFQFQFANAEDLYKQSLITDLTILLKGCSLFKSGSRQSPQASLLRSRFGYKFKTYLSTFGVKPF